MKQTKKFKEGQLDILLKLHFRLCMITMFQRDNEGIMFVCNEILKWKNDMEEEIKGGELYKQKQILERSKKKSKTSL